MNKNRWYNESTTSFAGILMVFGCMTLMTVLMLAVMLAA